MPTPDDDDPPIHGVSPVDLAQARRMPELHAFFEHRTVAELLMDLSWLSQYLIFRHHRDPK